jgi:hypothetical protein
MAIGSIILAIKNTVAVEAVKSRFGRALRARPKEGD